MLLAGRRGGDPTLVGGRTERGRRADGGGDQSSAASRRGSSLRTWTATWWRPPTPSLRKTWVRWDLIVFSLRQRAAPISLLESPRAISRTISRSRRLRGGSASGATASAGVRSAS